LAADFGVQATRGKVRAMAKLSTVDLKYIDRAFGMSSGYVLDFSNATFAEFFKREFAIDIYDGAYGDLGTSKGKHFRSFLLKARDATVARVLRGLWEYKEATNADAATKELSEKILGIANKLDGKTVEPVRPGPKAAVSSATYRSLHTCMQDLLRLPAQQRGYKFESFLKDAFNAFELQSKEAFRIVGEQIDGSFLLGHEVYLFEARWRDAAANVADLHTFHGKLEQKAAWTRGLFISYAGFTPDGLEAFGRGKKLVCMDGLDLLDSLSREISLQEVLTRKVRHAAERGVVFVSVRDLFA
jgi:hypothetical protein